MDDDAPNGNDGQDEIQELRSTSRPSSRSSLRRTSSRSPTAAQHRLRRSMSGKKLKRRASKKRLSSTSLSSLSGQSSSMTPEEEEELVRQLTSLQLPQMPPSDEMNATNNPPTMRLLIVADIDLESASALAESALAASAARKKRNSGDSTTNDASTNRGKENLLDRVDLCIACGPFCRDENLRQYYQGRQRKSFLSRQYSSNGSASSYHPNANGMQQGYRSPYPHHQPHSHQYPYGPTSSNSDGPNMHHPPLHKRTREETAALEGLMTAALSQLESIVCRVVFVPGRTDPISTITSPSSSSSSNNLNASSSSFAPSHEESTSSVGSEFENRARNESRDYSSSPQPQKQFRYTRERRLTPNSRNIHQHWLPLGPGLGCAGLLYLDWNSLQQQHPPPLEDGDDDDDFDEEFDDDDLDEDSIASPPSARNDREGPGVPAADVPPLSPQHDYAERAKAHGADFCKTLENLVQLAPPMSAVTDTPNASQINNVLKTSLFQSILVTHFHHLDKDEVPPSSSPPLDDDGVTNNDATLDGGEPSSTLLDSLPPSVDEEHHDEDEEESFDPPWPTEHEAFCALPIVQEHVLLEIASGLNSSGSTAKPMELPKGKLRVVLPGSLRERGEYCLVDVAFMKDPYHQKPNDYRWRVRRTRFHTLNDFL